MRYTPLIIFFDLVLTRHAIASSHFYINTGNITQRLIIIFILFVVGLIVLSKSKNLQKSYFSVSSLCLGIVLGGVVSNGIDIYVYGGIVDYWFISNFLWFNLADVAIVLGLAGMYLTLLKRS